MTYQALITFETRDDAGIAIVPSEIGKVIATAIENGADDHIYCGMCNDTGLQNGKPCPQPGCRKANGIPPFHITVTQLEVTCVETQRYIGRAHKPR